MKIKELIRFLYSLSNIQLTWEDKMKIVENTFPKGYKVSGMFVGLRRKRKDLTLIVSENLATVSGVFTTSEVKAAPVLWNKKITDSNNMVKAILVNSGHANSCTGSLGDKNAEDTAIKLSKSLNVLPENILVSSTGVIGVQLPMDKLLNGIDQILPTIGDSQSHWEDAATGILTTDTKRKTINVQLEIKGKIVTIYAIAKGSGMIHPNMATMLSFINTDLSIKKELLDEILTESTKSTYNMISVDGDTSTNDMVIVMANGQAENPTITEKDEDFYKFKEAIDFINEFLAKEIVRDGEGANKLIEVNVKGAKDDSDAKKLALSVLKSSLVKTAFFGEDANWGRVLCALGYSGAKFNSNKIALTFKSEFGEIDLIKNGMPIEFCEKKASDILESSDQIVDIYLEEGIGNATGWGCDLSYDYVKINSEYRS